MDAILEADRKAPRKQQHTAHRGMRREELVQLKIEQIDSARMLIHIRQGKRKKDRESLLPELESQVMRAVWDAGAMHRRGRPPDRIPGSILVQRLGHPR